MIPITFKQVDSMLYIQLNKRIRKPTFDIDNVRRATTLVPISLRGSQFTPFDSIGTSQASLFGASEHKVREISGDLYLVWVASIAGPAVAVSKADPAVSSTTITRWIQTLYPILSI